MTKQDIIARLREIKPNLVQEYSIKSIGLFGSFSDDSFTEDSDIDILIELEKPIGEASKNLPDQVKEKYNDVPWAEMYLLRNKVSHEYFGVDYEIIWDIASNYLPENRAQIEAILKKEL